MSTTNSTNWLAIGAASVAGMTTGFLWYGVLFVKPWMEANNFTSDEAANKMFKNGVEVQVDPAMQMSLNFLALVFYALVLNWLLRRANATTLQDGAMVGGAIGLMSLVGVYVNNMFAMSPSSLSMVDGSYALVLFTVMGAIIGAWQKR